MLLVFVVVLAMLQLKQAQQCSSKDHRILLGGDVFDKAEEVMGDRTFWRRNEDIIISAQNARQLLGP